MQELNKTDKLITADLLKCHDYFCIEDKIYKCINIHRYRIGQGRTNYPIILTGINVVTGIKKELVLKYTTKPLRIPYVEKRDSLLIDLETKINIFGNIDISASLLEDDDHVSSIILPKNNLGSTIQETFEKEENKDKDIIITQTIFTINNIQTSVISNFRVRHSY
jgi:hypothetical protein